MDHVMHIYTSLTHCRWFERTMSGITNVCIEAIAAVIGRYYILTIFISDLIFTLAVICMLIVFSHLSINSPFYC